MARKDNYLPFLTFLHEHKCDLDAQTWRLQETAVGIAIRLEQVEVLKFLVRNGADVNMYSNPERHTLPLYDAVQTRNIEILQTLLSAKTINVNPIEEWPSRWILVHCINIFPDGVESLLRAGADPNASGRYGGTPLAASAISKNTEMVKLLIQYGASVNFEDSMTQAPLQHSVTAGKQEHAIHTLYNLFPQIVTYFQSYTIMDEYSDSSIKSYTFQGLQILISSSQLLTEQLTT